MMSDYPPPSQEWWACVVTDDQSSTHSFRLPSVPVHRASVRAHGSGEHLIASVACVCVYTCIPGAVETV